MNRIIICFMAVVLSFAFWSPFLSYAEESQVARQSVAELIKSSIEEAITAYNKKDIKGFMSFMHPESPEYKSVLVRTETTVSKYDVTAQLLEYDYICMSGVYQLVRIKQRNMFTCGFYNCEEELLYALKIDQGQWKLWSVMKLDRKML